MNGQAVTFVYGQTWSDGEEDTITYAREFRYDQARQRYLNREVDPTTATWQRLAGGEEIWSDYDGDEIYGGFTIDGGGVVTDVRSFELGIGTFAWADGAPDEDSAQYYHADQIGTTRLLRGPGSQMVSSVYTAFGERIGGTMTGPGDRYGYAGAWGYQAHDDLPFLHVGTRYYDPSTGRFLQRDRVGIWAGLNVYEYVRSHPTVSVDPDGYIVETLWDIGVTIYDVAKGNWTDAALDVGAMLLPGVPAGGQKVIKGVKAVQKARKIKKAKEAYRRNKKFRRWFHKKYLEKMKIPKGKRKNPDIPDDDLRDAYEEWLEMGCASGG